MNGWREWYLSDGEGLTKVDPALAPIQAFLGVLGMPGLTAYAGLLRIGELKDDNRVFVSAASGAVGAVACRSRRKGCRVVGSAGSAEKCAYLLDELKLDGAINYRQCGDLSAALADAMPAGIDVYFDNVGGSHLTAALANMRSFGRIVACGMIEQYNATEAPKGPPNLMNIVGRRLTMRGFIVSDHLDMMDHFSATWAVDRRRKIIRRETVDDGIDMRPTR